MDFKLSQILQSLIEDVTLFNKYENMRRRVNVEQKLTCREFLKQKKMILNKQKA